MKGKTINFKRDKDILTGEVMDKVYISVDDNLEYHNETHYLVQTTKGEIVLVHPKDVWDINP